MERPGERSVTRVDVRPAPRLANSVRGNRRLVQARGYAYTCIRGQKHALSVVDVLGLPCLLEMEIATVISIVLRLYGGDGSCAAALRRILSLLARSRPWAKTPGALAGPLPPGPSLRFASGPRRDPGSGWRGPGGGRCRTGTARRSGRSPGGCRRRRRTRGGETCGSPPFAALAIYGGILSCRGVRLLDSDRWHYHLHCLQSAIPIN